MIAAFGDLFLWPRHDAISTCGIGRQHTMMEYLDGRKREILFPGKHHLNVEGNRVVAAIVSEALSNRGCLDSLGVNQPKPATWEN